MFAVVREWLRESVKGVVARIPAGTLLGDVRALYDEHVRNLRMVADILLYTVRAGAGGGWGGAAVHSWGMGWGGECCSAEGFSQPLPFP